MNFLVDNISHRVYECGMIEKGIFNDVDPNTELFKVTNDKGVFYAVASGFSIKTAENIPENYENYTYTDNGGFVELVIPPTQEEIVDNLSSSYEDLSDDVLDNSLAIAEMYEETTGLINDIQLALVEMFEV